MSGYCCDNCGGCRIVEDAETGEIVCTDCGAVLDRVIHPRPEWRAFSYGDRVRRERAGAPITPLLHDFGLSTLCPQGGVSGREDAFIIRVLSEIYRLSSSLNLPESVGRTAAALLRRLDAELRRSRRISKALPASLLYLACRIHGVPRTPSELAQYSDIHPSEILNCYARIAGSLRVRNALDAKAFIARLVGELKLDGVIEGEAVKIWESARELGLAQGRNVRAIAAAAVYIASRSAGRKVSQRRLAEAAGVSLSTLRRRIKEIGSTTSTIKI